VPFSGLLNLGQPTSPTNGRIVHLVDFDEDSDK
jgi:hypothetical protein